MTNKEIGKRIETARVSAGLNKKELAQKIKVADSTIKRYEDGEITKIKMPIIESIAYATAVNPMWIIGKSDDMEWETYLSIQKDSRNEYAKQWNLQFYEKKIIDIFSQLNDENKKKSISYADNLLSNQKMEEELVAAHQRTDVEYSSEAAKSDLDSMSDENF
ncbi:MAG: helix-turn-helix domain-containing protein [Lachnospiraceae bacterium]|nr:helix-turn-helix domain-containing protein [Lachnospiraceae bacterium]